MSADSSATKVTRNSRPKPASEEEVRQLSANGRVYLRSTAVKAVLLTKSTIVKQRDGRLVRGEAGDYLIQNVVGNTGPWVLPWDYFEANFASHELVENLPNDHNDNDGVEKKPVKFKPLKLSAAKEIVFETSPPVQQ